MRFKLFEKVDDIQQLLQDSEPRLVRADRYEICVIRRKDQLIAFLNGCPHMGENLHNGKVNHLGEIVCPLHSYKFNLQTGEEENQRCESLRFLEVELTENGVFINL